MSTVNAHNLDAIDKKLMETITQYRAIHAHYHEVRELTSESAHRNPAHRQALIRAANGLDTVGGVMADLISLYVQETVRVHGAHVIKNLAAAGLELGLHIEVDLIGKRETCPHE